MVENKKLNCLFLCFYLLCLIELSTCSNLFASNLNAGIILSDDKGKTIYAENQDNLFIPASILKILTSLASIHILGEKYHFPTKYFWDDNSNNLYIKGFGDPLLISEIIEQLSDEIVLNTKVKQIENIILDQSFFSQQIKIPGKGNSLNPYDASCGAICANFNTINFIKDNQSSKFISAEPQTPLFDIFYQDIINTGLNRGRVPLSKQHSLLYPGFLIKYFLERNDVTVNGSVIQGEFYNKNKEVGSFLSPFKLTDIVQKLLQFSNNFIANQLLLTLGAKSFGEPATIEKGVRALKFFSKELSPTLNWNTIKIHEGSGLSRNNLISPNHMLTILLEFMPYYSLLKNKGTDYYKTGTLLNVRTRAGYLLGRNNRLYPYVIMVNQKNRGYKSILTTLLNKVSKVSEL